MATTFTWDGSANIWASDHWGRSGAAPKWPKDTSFTNADEIVILTAVHPTTQAGGAVTVLNYTCAGNDFDSGANVTVTRNLLMGTVGGADAPTFTGTALSGCKVLFQGASINAGTLPSYAVFKDTSVANGTVDQYAVFNDSSVCTSGTINDNATFNNTSANSGTVGNLAIFNSTAAQGGTFTGTQYYANVAVKFSATTSFTGTAPIIFTLMSPGASIDGKFTTNGGATPVEITVNSVYDSVGPFPLGSSSIGPYPMSSNSVGPFPVE